MEISKKFGVRLLCFLVSLLCILLLVQPAAANDSGEGAPVGICTANVYYYPSEMSMVIGQIPHGERLQVLEQSDSFFGVDCFGMTGYIPKSQVLCNEQGECYVNCPLYTEQSKLFFRYRADAARTMQDSAAEMSQTLLGVPYVYGGMSPGGFDCSGFTYYIFAKQGIELHRCADDQLRDGLIVAQEDLQKGDMVFFATYGPWIASHVGVYIGDGKMIHAGSKGVTCSSLDAEYWASRYVGARRVIDITDALPIQENESGVTEAAYPEKSCIYSLHMVK